MDILKLRTTLSSKYFDDQRLKAALGADSHARRTIGKLVREGWVVRVRKGLYLWSQEIDPTPYSTPVLANLIYGPSYLSLEYALSYHGLIPERVEEVTSVTPKRRKQFKTPIGNFRYEYLNLRAYPLGVSLKVLSKRESFLIASREKAILDLLALRQTKELSSCPDEVYAFLIADFRIDESELACLDKRVLAEIASRYTSRFVRDFGKALTNSIGE